MWYHLILGPSPRIKISFFLLSISRDEFISAQKITVFFPMLPSGNENTACESNLIPKPVHTYRSLFLANLTPLNKQPFKVKSVFKSRDHGSNSLTILY